MFKVVFYTKKVYKEYKSQIKKCQTKGIKQVEHTYGCLQKLM